MNKQLDLIEAHLHGRAKVKVWDCSREDAFRELSPSQFKLWFYLWTHENDAQESYQSLKTMEKGSHMSRHTVIEAKKFLLANGWLVAPGGTAADKYTPATPGASKVLIYRADDPISGGRSVRSRVGLKDSSAAEYPRSTYVADGASEGSAEIAPAASAESAPRVKGDGAVFAPKVSGSGSSSGLDLDSDSASVSVSASTYGYGAYVTKPSLPSGEVPPSAEEKKPKPNTKTNINTKSPSPAPESATCSNRKRSAPDGTAFPSEFDSWSNVQRLLWLEEHKLPSAKPETASAPAKPETTSAKPEKPSSPEPKTKSAPEPEVESSPVPAKAPTPAKAQRESLPELPDWFPQLTQDEQAQFLSEMGYVLAPEPKPEPEESFGRCVTCKDEIYESRTHGCCCEQPLVKGSGTELWNPLTQRMVCCSEPEVEIKKFEDEITWCPVCEDDPCSCDGEQSQFEDCDCDPEWETDPDYFKHLGG
jgi:hypothetical protein